MIIAHYRLMADECACPICNGSMQKYQPFCTLHEQAWKESPEFSNLDITSDDSYDYCVASFVYKYRLLTQSGSIEETYE